MSNLENNTVALQEILAKVNALPEAGGGSDVDGAIVDGTISGEYKNDQIEKIAYGRFYSAKNLTGVSFPNVTTMAGYGFRGCTNLKSIDMPNLTTISGYDFYQVGATEIYLPKLNNVVAYSFGSTSAKKIILPSLKTATAYGFRSSQVETMDFTALTSIPANGLYECTKLTHLILRADAVCKLGNISGLGGTPIASGTGYIYVPASLVDSYKAATNWSTYADQIRAIEDYPEITGG